MELLQISFCFGFRVKFTLFIRSLPPALDTAAASLRAGISKDDWCCPMGNARHTTIQAASNLWYYTWVKDGGPLHPCSIKTREVLGNPDLMPKSKKGKCKSTLFYTEGTHFMDSDGYIKPPRFAFKQMNANIFPTQCEVVRRNVWESLMGLWKSGRQQPREC